MIKKEALSDAVCEGVLQDCQQIKPQHFTKMRERNCSYQKLNLDKENLENLPKIQEPVTLEWAKKAFLKLNKAE